MLLGILIILILATTLGMIFTKKTIECLPMAIFGIIFIIYIFGIINLFLLGIVVIFLSSISGLAYIIYRCIKKGNNLFDYLTTSLLFFIGLIFFVYFIVKGTRIICYDEFTAWGMFVKTSLESNSLYIYSPFQALAKSYQSATAIFQIFMETANLQFSEDVMFISMSIIYFSMASVILKNLKTKNILEIALRSVLIFMIPLSFFMWPINYYTILVDVVLGFAFAYIIFYYLTNKLENFTLINISLAIFFLSCSKGNGLILSAIAIILISIDLLFFKRKQLFEFINFTSIRLYRKMNFRKVIIILLPLLATLFTFVSWNICLWVIGLTPSQGEVYSMVSAIFSAEFYSKINPFMAVVSNVLLEYKNFLIIIIALLLSIIMFKNKISTVKKDYKRYMTLLIAFILFTLLYVLFLFLVCNSMITVENGVIALRRYLFTIVAADMVLVTLGLIYIFKKKLGLNISILLVALIYTTTPVNTQLEMFVSNGYTNQYIEYRKQFDPIIDKLKNIDAEHDVVYYIQETEVDIYISNFTVFPIELSPIPFWYNSLSPKNYNELLLSKSSIGLFKNSTSYELERINDKKTGNLYIYIYKVSEDTNKRYGNLFKNNGLEMMDNSLYLVTNKNNSPLITLVN